MAQDPRIAELIEELAMQTIMVEPDDVMTLGSILEKLERLANIEGRGGRQSLKEPGRALKELVEKIILQEIPSPAEGCQLLRQGVGVLQNRISSASSSPSNEVESLLKKISRLGNGPDPAPSGKKDPSPPAAEEIADPQKDMDIYKDFITEGMEHLSTIELNIINLEQDPDNQECINAVFRPFHTIKGVAGFLNLQEIQRFSHAMESLLDEARNERLSITPEIIDFILDAVDVLKGAILDLRNNLDLGLIQHAPLDIEAYHEKMLALKTNVPKAPSPSVSSLQRPSQASPNSIPLGEILTAKGVVSENDVRKALQEQALSSPEMKIGEILVKEKKARPQEVIQALRDQRRGMALFTDSTVKVEMQKLDNLVDMVGELVIAQSLIQQNPTIESTQDPKLIRDLSQLRRITAELQKISMSLRTVPIRQTFQKMIRLVRDLAKKSGKQVDLVMSGEDTEIDRNMVDMLYEPLVHMIRNAVDHGIEPPEKRKASGKLETGRVFLRALQRDGYIVIEIEDDGQGLNRERIIKKAREKGLISKEASLTDYQIDSLIFEPGFSTSDKITDISGRGVGMDVVRKTIDQLKGKMEIFSNPAKGCRFVIRVPLTLAIMDGIVVRVGPERYVIPTVFIKETVRPNPEDIKTIYKKGELIRVRGNLLPLIRLHQVLGVSPKKENPWEALVIVTENAGYQKGLVVDDLIGKQEVVIKNVGERLKSVKGVAGATIMGDGRVGLILDIQGIFDLDQNSPAPLAA